MNSARRKAAALSALLAAFALAFSSTAAGGVPGAQLAMHHDAGGHGVGSAPHPHHHGGHV